MIAKASRRSALVALLAGCALQSPSLPAGGAARDALAAPAAQAVGTSAQRGREIYLRGTSPDGGAIDAVIGAGTTVVRASLLPCVNCHGPEGRGRPEGGVTPSDLRWSSLRRPYEVVTPSGRRHPTYSERLLGRAVTMGVDPAGNRLDDAMPRYRLSRVDLDDLLAYLKTIGSEVDPGISAAAIRIGVLLPSSGPRGGLGGAVSAALQAFFDEQNRRGGIYGRRIELRTAELPDAPGAPERAEEALRAFLDHERPFALTGGFVGAAEDRIATLAEAQSTPLLSAVAPCSIPARPLLRQVFYLASSPARPSAASAEALQDYRALASAHELSGDHLAAQLSALVGAKLLVEGLKRAGRDLRREGLITALESIHDFQTGLLPPISYGKNRRVGAPDGCVIAAGTK